MLGQTKISRRQCWSLSRPNGEGLANTAGVAVDRSAILQEHRRWLVEKQNPGLAAGWVFPSLRGKLKTPNTLAKTWQGCLDKIGMKERFTVHGLRRTFNDLTRRAGADGIVTRALTGHVTEGMTAHYSTVGLDERRAAVARALNLVPLPQTVDACVDGARR